MKIIYVHKLSIEEAHERLNKLLINMQKEHADMIRNPKIEWDATKTHMKFSVEISIFSIDGYMHLQEQEVVIEGNIPLILKGYSNKIEDIIKAELIKLLS